MSPFFPQDTAFFFFKRGSIRCRPTILHIIKDKLGVCVCEDGDSQGWGVQWGEALKALGIGLLWKPEERGNGGPGFLGRQNKGKENVWSQASSCFFDTRVLRL